MKKILEKKLIDINEIIKTKYHDKNQIGVLSGISGISLFQFYYAKYLNIEKHAELGLEMLTSCINKINEGYNHTTYCTGIAGIGWVLDHLEQEGFIDIENDDLLSQFDDLLHKIMVSDLEKGNYDFLHGAIGYAFYFFNRYRNTKSEVLKKKYKIILLEFIDLLKEISEKSIQNKFKWLSVLDMDTRDIGYNLCLSHGMSSIVGILTKLYKYEDFRINVEEILKGTINYILSNKSKEENTVSLFPIWISKKEEVMCRSRLAWCYGDLGIGIQFWNAAKVLNDKNLEDVAMAIMKHATKRKEPENTLVKDAGICHGSFGNAQIFYRMFKETKDSKFKEAADFWIQDGINKAIFKDGYAGFKKLGGIDKEWKTEISLLEGIAGIGLAIIDYLADFDNTWDECLMIS